MAHTLNKKYNLSQVGFLASWMCPRPSLQRGPGDSRKVKWGFDFMRLFPRHSLHTGPRERIGDPLKKGQ